MSLRLWQQCTAREIQLQQPRPGTLYFSWKPIIAHIPKVKGWNLSWHKLGSPHTLTAEWHEFAPTKMQPEGFLFGRLFLFFWHTFSDSLLWSFVVSCFSFSKPCALVYQYFWLINHFLYTPFIPTADNVWIKRARYSLLLPKYSDTRPFQDHFYIATISVFKLTESYSQDRGPIALKQDKGLTNTLKIVWVKPKS